MSESWRLPRSEVLAVGLLLVALIGFAPQRLVDADALMRLATGRWIVAHAQVPNTDPFTFADPGARWNNPEWLGDTLWYLLYRWGGETALVTTKLLLLCVGLVLAAYSARGLGARSLWPGTLLLLLMLPAAATRFTVRNHVHALWLAPVFVCLSLMAHSQAQGPKAKALWFALVPLGWLWANLHGSAVIGWLIVAAVVGQQAWQGQRAQLGNPLAVLLCLVMTPLVAPVPGALYAQLLDHALGASVYRELIAEWKAPISARGLLAIAPLYLLSVFALSCAPQALRQRRLLDVTLMLVGLGLALTSRRFLALAAVLAAPPLAAAWSRATDDGRRWRSLSRVGLGLSLVYLLLAATAAARRPDVHVLTQADGPQRAAGFLQEHAPRGARLFNSFNDGPWLLWLTAPRVQHYMDPRNNLGADALRRYAQRILPHPQRLELLLGAHPASLVLVRHPDSRMQALGRHLAQSSHWALVYQDELHSLYARHGAANDTLIRRFSIKAR